MVKRLFGTRVLAGLLALMMLAALMPANLVGAAPAARQSASPSDIVVIDEVRITGWTEPSAGMKAGDYDYSALKSETENVEVVSGSACWFWNQSEISMKDDETFEHGKAYYLQIDLHCAEGCIFGNDLTVYLNGSTDLVDTNTVYVIEETDRDAFFATKDYGIPEEGEPEYGHIVVTAGTGGSASASTGTQFVGMDVQLYAKPDSGYAFKEWRVVNGGLLVEDIELIDTEDGVYSFEMVAGDVELEAVFEAVTAPTSPTDVTPTSPTDVTPTSPTDAEPTSPTKPTDVVLPSEPVYRQGIVRLGGTDRFATASLIAAEGWERSGSVIIANAYNYADALAGAPLAYALDAPILLASGGTASDTLISDLRRLNPGKVIILGGPAAISYSLEYSIQVNGYNIQRVYGNTRYETAVKIAEELAKVSGNPSEVFIASGVNYPDALSASSVAALKHSPILYSPKNGALDDSTSSFIRNSGAGSACILGGTAAVGSQAQSKLNSAGVSTVKRIGGDDRYSTSMMIADTYKSVFGGKAAALATGKIFPDALAGSVLAAKLKMPVLLTDNATVNDDAKYFLADTKPAGLYVFGSYGVISEAIAGVYYDYAGNYSLSKEQAAAYLAEIRALEAKYGKSTLYSHPNSNAYHLLGLCYARLIDIDGDSSPELLCVYSAKNGDYYYDIDYTCAIYTYSASGGIYKSFEGGISNLGQDLCPTVTLLRGAGGTLYYTCTPDGTFTYYAMPEGKLEPIFVVEYDEYGDEPSATVNGVKTTIENAEKRLNEFIKGYADDQTRLYNFSGFGSKSFIPQIQAFTEAQIETIEQSAK